MVRLACTFLVIVFSSYISSAYADAIGKVVAIAGSPQVTNADGSHRLTSGSDIFEHDKIVVGGGNAQILFIDGTRMVVGAGSTLVVEKFLLRGGSTAQNFTVNALRGTFRFITGKSAKSAYNIKTANATIGIRGTGFDFWVENKTGVAVHEGRVNLCNRSKNCVDLKAGCEVGIAQSNGSLKLSGDVKVANLLTRFPFVISQSQLNRRFQLDTKACRAVINFYTGGQGGGSREPPPKNRGE